MAEREKSFASSSNLGFAYERSRDPPNVNNYWGLRVPEAVHNNELDAGPARTENHTGTNHGDRTD